MHVILVHGMGRTVFSWHRLGRDLRQAGHQVDRIGYVAAFESFDRIVSRVRRRLEKLSRANVPYVVAGHSLGGVLLRAALVQMPPLALAPSHLIMLGTPNRPARLAARFRGLLPYRWVNGDCGQRLSDPAFFEQLPPPAVPYTIVAGTRGWMHPKSPFGAEPNDGVVAVNETLIRGDDTPHIFPVRHTFMMNDARVRALVLEIVSRGQRQ